MDKGYNIELVLVVLTLISGLIVLFSFIKKSDKPRENEPFLIDYAKSFFPILLFVLIIRSFVAEPFRIPSGSMIPTLEVGDFILVKKYAYGIRLPVLQNKIIETGKPQRGDVVVFRYPPNPETNYIKRLIGLPGDHIKWTHDKKLIINGVPVKYKDNGSDSEAGELQTSTTRLKETLPGDEPHDLMIDPGFTSPGEWDVPQGNYFMMGDNRDHSSDSRVWDFVPEENLVGKAAFVWMHWNWFDGGDGFQAGRIGTSVD